MRCTVKRLTPLMAAVLTGLFLMLGTTTPAFAQATSFDIYGYRANEGGGGALDVKWTKGNLGNTWSEGEWVAYKLTVTNIQNNYPNFVDFPDLTLSYDFTNKGNRFVDLVRSIQISTQDLNDLQGWPNDAGAAYPLNTRQDIEDAQNDFGNAAPLENVWSGFELLRDAAPVNFGAQIENLVNRDLALNDGTPADERHTFTVPTVAILEYLANESLPTTVDTIVLYFQLHESRSFIWQNSLQEGYDQTPSDLWGGYLYSLAAYDADVRNGSGYVPGSSGHIHLESVSGSKDVPIPIPERLPGAVSGLKWFDENGDGVYDIGTEPTLDGWRIHVEGSLEGIVFTTSTLTDDTGYYSFPNLTSNVTWIISEDAQREDPPMIGYMQTYPVPGSTEGVGTGIALTSPPASIADNGWSVPLTIDVFDQGNLNFGNKLCQPQLTCLDPDTVECDESTDPSNTGMPIVDVNCGPYQQLTYIDDTIPGACANEFTIARTWIVVDAAGMADTCLQTIEVEDNTPPQLTCPPDISVQCIEDVPAPTPGSIPATDNCGPALVTHIGDQSDGNTCPEIITRTYQAEDECGNIATCTQTITVNDTQPPSITCPADISVQCIEDVPAADITLVSASDNCDDDLTIVHVGDQSDGNTCPEVITRTYSATDDCGNVSTCTQTITVDDTQPPSITCPADISVQCIDDVPAADITLVSASDNCDDDVTIAFVGDQSDGNTCPEVITRTYSATDDCGNVSTCTQTITVDDTQPPSISCPGPVSVQCIEDVPAADITLVTASDNCDDDLTIAHVGDQSDGNTCPEVITRTYSATDDCGNVSTCTQTITVDDTQPPSITCPADISVQCIDDVPAADITLVSASDNCDDDLTIAHVGDQSDGNTCPEVITRTYSATDDCGNVSTCTQTITVIDTQPPSITCPADISVQCIEDVPAADITLVSASDNCDDDLTIVHVGDQSDGNTCPEVITRTYSATDDCGNVSTCTQTITVDDTQPPSISCPADVSVQCRSLVPSPNPALVSAIDNCDDSPTIAFVGDQSDGNTCPEVITRTYSATDDCGNVSTCTQTITVDDDTPPVLAGCPSDTTISCDEAVPPPANVTATDNCGPVNVSMTVASGTGSCDQEYSMTRTWTATDACGNTASCSQTINVVDTTAPVLTCADPDTIECEGTVTFTPPSVSDNCDPSPTVTMVRDTSYDGPGAGETTWERFWVAVDDCGNESDTCSQMIIELACQDFCTFTIGGWGTECPESQVGDMSSTQPGCVRDHYFSTVYPGGSVVIGNGAFNTLTFTSSAAIEAFLPMTSTPGVLTYSDTDPVWTPAGVLAGQVLALQLNVDYSCAGIFSDLGLTPPGFCYGDEPVGSCGLGHFDGLTVGQFLAIANDVLSGNPNALDAYPGVSVSDVNEVASCLNELHSECDPFALFLADIIGTDDPRRGNESSQATSDDNPAEKLLPTEFGLSQNYPNPFNPETNIEFALPQNAHVQIEIYNVRGQLVRTLVDRSMEAGYHIVSWDAGQNASGVYLYRITAGEFTETRKMLLLK